MGLIIVEVLVQTPSAFVVCCYSPRPPPLLCSLPMSCLFDIYYYVAEQWRIVFYLGGCPRFPRLQDLELTTILAMCHGARPRTVRRDSPIRHLLSISKIAYRVTPPSSWFQFPKPFSHLIRSQCSPISLLTFITNVCRKLS